MVCPICQTKTLNPSYLENLFPCHSCVTCEGNWIRMSDYLRWQDKNEVLSDGEHTSVEIEDNEKALICPETGRLMTSEAQSKDKLEAMYQEKFKDDYEELKRIRAWLEQQEGRTDYLAFLLLDDPYSL